MHAPEPLYPAQVCSCVRSSPIKLEKFVADLQLALSRGWEQIHYIYRKLSIFLGLQGTSLFNLPWHL